MHYCQVHGRIIELIHQHLGYRFTTYQDARRVRLVDGLETNILRVSPVNIWDEVDTKIAIRLLLVLVSNFLRLIFPSSNSLANGFTLFNRFASYFIYFKYIFSLICHTLQTCRAASPLTITKESKETSFMGIAT